MKHSISSLGIILLAILVALSSGSLLLLLLQEQTIFLGIALGIVFIVVMTIFISFLLLDLYKSRLQNQQEGFKDS